MAIEFSEEQRQLFYDNGYTDEDIIEAVKDARQRGKSDKEIQTYFNNKINEFENETPSVEAEMTKPKGIDLTPSGLLDKASMGVFSALATPVEMIRSKEKNPIEAYKNVYDATDKMMADVKKQSPVLSGAKDFGIDMLGYSKILPVLKGNNIPQNIGAYLGNIATQGTATGALEGLKTGNAGEGATIGSLVVGAMSGVPIVGKGVGKLASKIYLNSFPSLKEKTVKQLIKPNSQALDLTDDTAQNLLMDTTERIQKDYKNLIDNAGLEVKKAALNLPEERGVFASSLKDILNDIYNGYSTSGIKELNPAFNNAGDVYADINKLIEAGTTGEKVSATKLNDIMGNLKNYPIDWNKTSANDKKAILKQIYGEYARRLSNLSPELRKANKTFSKLAKFDDNEGVRKIISPNVLKGENIDTASTALRNYNSTITKGNTNRNIQDLEKLLVANGKEPFLNTIDDINAANELLKTAETGFNPFGLTDKLKLLEKPIFMANRGINRAVENNPIIQKLQNIHEVLKPFAERLPQAGAKGAANMLYGGVEYNDYR